jgi:endonuclease YncB( thermonuclease family)
LGRVLTFSVLLLAGLLVPVLQPRNDAGRLPRVIYPDIEDEWPDAESPVPGSGTRFIRGAARVVDGDTLDVAGRRIRLHGIDAPEKGQICRRPQGPYACGEEAAWHLRTIIGERPLRCESRAVDGWGRVVATCHVGDTDVARVMVRLGWAMASRRFTGAYARDEHFARARAIGVWAGPFDPPDQWRASRQ